MPTLYHGTIDKFVPSILTEGLKSVKEYGWDVTRSVGSYNPVLDDPEGLVYMAQSPRYAADYARAKVRYFQTDPGKEFVAVNGVRMVKGRNAPVITGAKAVVLQLSVPDSVRIQQDEADSRGKAFRGIISPGEIKMLPLAEAIALEPSHEEEKDEFDALLAEILALGRVLKDHMTEEDK